MKFLDITKKGLATVALAAVSLTSCVNDLDVTPIDPDVQTPDKVYASEDGFEQVLMKIYAGFSVSGQKGPAGDGDLGGFDEGHSQYWRAYFVNNVLPTDEAINGWNDGNLPKLSQVTWGANNEFVKQFYYRAIYQVSVANEFLRTSREYKKAEYSEVDTYYAEARFLRALAYWHALDLYGNGIPFTTEHDVVGPDAPQPAGEQGGSELFTYLESELLEIAGEVDGATEVLIEPRSGWGGQADKACAWMLLAKLYLNNESYIDAGNYPAGKSAADYYAAARVFVNKVINEGGYNLQNSLINNYTSYSAFETLFLADNYRCTDEIIFSINYDGLDSKTYGGSTYLINAAIGGSNMVASDYGTSGGWGGNRVLRELVGKFSNDDNRALFFKEGQDLNVEDLTQFSQGYASIKFKNTTQDTIHVEVPVLDDEGKEQKDENGNIITETKVKPEPGKNMAEGFADTNIPVFRLADAYLMAAELDLRIDGAVSSINAGYVNQLRARGGVADYNVALMNLDYILDERARELYWEGHRRTDLIRFGKFSSGYNWQFKGGDVDGKDVDEKFNVMPIPYADIVANPNLIQNVGY